MMNPYAKESPQQYAFLKCNEAIVQTRLERSVLHELLNQAKADNAVGWIAAVTQKLKDHRIKLNRLTARRSNLHKKLGVSQSS